MSLLSRLFARPPAAQTYAALYDAVVAEGRNPFWYREGEVPDTVTGRFDMIAAVLALVLLRIEREGTAQAAAAARLTERFIADMEGSVRQLGIGDLVVGKQLGGMMSALGGRLAAFRSAIAGGGDFTPAVTRNIFHDAPPSPQKVEHVARRLERLQRLLVAQPIEALLAGRLPPL